MAESEEEVDKEIIRRKGSRGGSLAQGIAESAAILKADSKGAFSMHSEAHAFRKDWFYTGLVEVDLNLKPTVGSRIQILGEAHAGKSLCSALLMAAAQRTCRQCLTPIIEFINDWTGETATTCRCGSQDPMKVVLLDAEACFDPAWAAVWGVELGGKLSMSGEDDDYTEEIPGVRVSPDANFCVIRIADAEQCETVVNKLIKSGAVDMLVIDSLAALLPRTRSEGKNMIGDKAKAVTRLIESIVAAQGEAYSMDGVAPTLVMPNQYRVKIGGFAMHGTPKEAAGGMALKYGSTLTWDLRTKYSDGSAKGYGEQQRFGDTVVSVKKDKETGGTGATARYRVYLRDHTMSRVDYHAGDTDEGGRLFAFVKEMGALDERWFKKAGAKYEVLGRTFTKVADINTFLLRPDIGYLLRYPLYAQMFTPGMRQHLGRERFDYTPFKDDPILALYEEADKQTGINVQAGPREHTAVMLGKQVPGTTGPASGSEPEAEADLDFLDE